MPPRRRTAPPTDKRSIRVPRALLYGSAALLLAGLGTLTAFGLWFVHRIERLERVRTAAAARYAALDAEFPFRAESGASPSAARAAAYFRARAALVGAAPDSVDRLAAELISGGEWREPRLIRALSGDRAARFLDDVLADHARTLRAEGMSAAEYLWTHGLAMRDELAGRAGEGVRSDYERVLRSLGRMAAANENLPFGFTLEAYERGLEAIYGDAPRLATSGPPPGEGTAARAIDLVCAAFALDAAGNPPAPPAPKT